MTRVPLVPRVPAVRGVAGCRGGRVLERIKETLNKEKSYGT